MCVYVYIYIYTYIHIHIYMYNNVSPYMYIYIYICYHTPQRRSKNECPPGAFVETTYIYIYNVYKSVCIYCITTLHYVNYMYNKYIILCI